MFIFGDVQRKTEELVGLSVMDGESGRLSTITRVA